MGAPNALYPDIVLSHFDHDVHIGRVLASLTLCLATPSNPDESLSASLKVWIKQIQNSPRHS